MKISTRARGMAAILVAMGLILTSVALFTCHWFDISVSLGIITTKSSVGLFRQDNCGFFLGDAPAWNTATFAMMVISFAAQIVLVLFIIGTSFLPRAEPCQLMKADLFLITIAHIMLLASLITYGISSDGTYHFGSNSVYSLGYSYWLCIPAVVLNLLAVIPISYGLNQIHRGGGDCEWRI